jgi:hypothetical protein
VTAFSDSLNIQNPKNSRGEILENNLKEGCMDTIFQTGSVPVAVAAKVYGKDASWIRAGIISGWLPIGKATRNGQLITQIEEMNSRLGRINFYISPKLLYEQTGYLWKGEKA